MYVDVSMPLGLLPPGFRPGSVAGNASFGDLPIEVDTESLVRGAWEGLEPGLTTWVNDELGPALSKALVDAGPSIEKVVGDVLTEAIPILKRETAIRSTIPYLVMAGTWMAALLAGVWIVARNTSRKDD